MYSYFMENNKETLVSHTQKFISSGTGGARVAKIILTTIALTGFILIATIAPNVIQIFGENKRGKKYTNKQYKDSLRNLSKRGYVQVIGEKNNVTKVKLTNKGQNRVKKFNLDELSLRTPKHWDRRWRVLIFDIPNTKTRARGAFQKKVKELGLHQLQKSVWIHPYDFEDEVLFTANVFGVESFIEILTVEKFLHEKIIMKKFF